jgi:hypothetical protein
MSIIAVLHTVFHFEGQLFLMDEHDNISFETLLANGFGLVISLITIEALRRYFMWASIYYQGAKTSFLDIHKIPTKWIIAVTFFCWGFILFGIIFFEILELG